MRVEIIRPAGLSALIKVLRESDAVGMKHGGKEAIMQVRVDEGQRQISINEFGIGLSVPF